MYIIYIYIGEWSSQDTTAFLSLSLLHTQLFVTFVCVNVCFHKELYRERERQSLLLFFSRLLVCVLLNCIAVSRESQWSKRLSLSLSHCTFRGCCLHVTSTLWFDLGHFPLYIYIIDRSSIMHSKNNLISFNRHRRSNRSSIIFYPLLTRVNKQSHIYIFSRKISRRRRF